MDRATIAKFVRSLSTWGIDLSERGPSSYCGVHVEAAHWTFILMPPASVISPSISSGSPGESIQSLASRLGSLSRSLSSPPQEQAEIKEPEIEAGGVIPPVPETLEDTGLAASVVHQLILKMLYSQGELLGGDLAEKLGLKFSLIEKIIDFLKHQRLIEAKRSLGMGNSTVLFALTETGRNSTRECLESNQYTGPAPVPLHQYTQIIRRQRRADGWLTPEALQHAYRRMVMTPRILAQIGPAVSSGNSFLIYGQPGNGKTFLAEALMNVDDTCVYIPYALDCQGTIVQVYDPLYHQPVQDTEEQSVFSSGPQHDRRWIKCRRPFIVTGGELTLGMLDLNYNATSKVYDAPYQLKANNGIYLIDDFGRQQCTPAEILNRWIVPMERRVDYLKFHSGGKITVPFEAFLIFSTNQNPEQLGDEAFLRRIQYKMLLRSPDEHEFQTIFQKFCESRSLPHQDGLIAHFIEKHYRKTKRAFRRCHPRDVISHAIDLIHFEKLPFELTGDLLDRAFESCFLEETGD
jgi:DNA-binding MarR family transcriptional regulator